MAWNWKILKGAVEQAILFPSEKDLREYITKLTEKKMSYEIVCKTYNADGSLTVVMRKPYNNNEFLYSADELLP